MVSPHSRVVVVTAAFLGVLYFLLGLSFVICFVLVNCGVIVHDSLFVNLHKSYTMLIITILITFLGMFTSIMVIHSVRRKKSLLIFPWLVFHLLSSILIILSGIAFVLHFIIDKKYFMRAALCFIPIMTGILFLCTWVKVFQEMREIKFGERKTKTLSNSLTMKSSSKVNRQEKGMKDPPRAENIYSQPHGDTEETEHTKPDISPQANKYPEPVDSLSHTKLLLSVKQYKP